MGVLIKNEFYKLKREWFMVFLLLLSLLPIITGGAGAIFNSSTKSLADLFFFMNNQFSMFFPMVIFILIGSLFYQEYKNKTYINWITYGFSKKEAIPIKSRSQHRYRHWICGGSVYLIRPACSDTQWSRQNDRRYFPVCKSGNRVWNGSLCYCFDNYLSGSNRYQSKPQYYCDKRSRGYIWFCILPVHRFRKRLCHSGQLRIPCVHVFLG